MSGEMDKPLISRHLLDSDGSLAEVPSEAPKVGILGSGDFARSLAARLVSSGFSVVVGSRNPKRTAGLFPSAAQVTFQADAVESPDVIFVAMFREHYSSLCGLSDQLAGKILVDVSNPTEQEHLRHHESNAEYLASLFPTCTVVKAFNVISAWTLQSGPRDGNRQVSARGIPTIITINISGQHLLRALGMPGFMCIISARLPSLQSSILQSGKLRLMNVNELAYTKSHSWRAGCEPSSYGSEIHVRSSVTT